MFPIHKIGTLPHFVNGNLREIKMIYGAVAFAPFLRKSQAIAGVARIATASCTAAKGRTSIGLIPEKLGVKARAMVTAGLAKDVEAVNQ